MEKFFKTIIGSWIAIFVKASIAQIIYMVSEGIDIYSINYKSVLGAGILALIGVIYNYFNKDYTYYGKTVNPDIKPNPGHK